MKDLKTIKKDSKEVKRDMTFDYLEKMLNEDFSVETSVELDGYDDTTFTVICLDGEAIARANREDVIIDVKLTYPKLRDMTAEEKADCLDYRGIQCSIINVDTLIQYGDVMMRHGKMEFLNK